MSQVWNWVSGWWGQEDTALTQTVAVFVLLGMFVAAGAIVAVHYMNASEWVFWARVRELLRVVGQRVSPVGFVFFVAACVKVFDNKILGLILMLGAVAALLVYLWSVSTDKTKMQLYAKLFMVVFTSTLALLFLYLGVLETL